MRDIVLDEVEKAKYLIDHGETLDDTRYTLSLIARYDTQIAGMDMEATSAHLWDYTDRAYKNLSLNYLEHYITYYSEHAADCPLTSIESVPITQTELETVGSLETTKLQCIAFAALAMVKYDTLRYPAVDYWLNGDRRGELVKRANVSISDKDLAYEMHKLYQDGLIGLSKKIDNCSLHILYASPLDAEDVALQLGDQDFKDLGYTLRSYWGEPFIRCQECGRWIRKSKNGRRKFCEDCAADNHRAIDAARKRRMRE